MPIICHLINFSHYEYFSVNTLILLLLSIINWVVRINNKPITYSRVILFVDLNSFVSLCCNEPALRLIEHTCKDPRLAVQRTGLHCCMNPLEVVASPPVPHVNSAVISWCEKGQPRTDATMICKRRYQEKKGNKCKGQNATVYIQQIF